MSARGLITKLRCSVGWHRSYDEIQRVSFPTRFGCPDCGRQWAMNHDARVVLPWSPKLEAFYRGQGHDVDTDVARWQAYRALRNLRGSNG